MTPLHNAALGSEPRVAEELIRYGANINANVDARIGIIPAFDRDFMSLGTPLHMAVRYSRPDMVEMLIEAGADVNIKDADGYTPLDCAQSGGINVTSAGIRDLVEVIRHLEQAGAKRARDLP